MTKKWEVHQLIGNGYENVWTEDDKPLQFDSETEAGQALDAHLKDLKSAVADGHMEESEAGTYRIVETVCPAELELGYRFKLPGYKHNSPTHLNMIVTYRFHTGTVWKYHCGLIVAKEGEAVNPPYNSLQSLKTISGLQVVDYCTSAAWEIEMERMK